MGMGIGSAKTTSGGRFLDADIFSIRLLEQLARGLV